MTMSHAGDVVDFYEWSANGDGLCPGNLAPASSVIPGCLPSKTKRQVEALFRRRKRS